MAKTFRDRERDGNAVLDELVDDSRYFLTTHPLRSTRGWPLELHAIAIAYLACYAASIGSRHTFSTTGWSSFRTSVVARMAGIHDNELRPLPANHLLISGAYGFYPYLATFEKFANARQLGSTELQDALLVEISGGDDMRAIWCSFFGELTAQATNDTLFKIWLVFESKDSERE